MQHQMSTLNVIFTIANILITAGYVAVPILVLRYLPLTRTVLLWGVGFFLGCAGTHLGMALLVHSDVGLFWTLEHVAQAVCTWGFIVTFHSMLRAASKHRVAAPGATTLDGGDDK